MTDPARIAAALRDWACFRLMMVWPYNGRLAPFEYGSACQRLSWRLYMRILPHAGSWAYRDEIAAAERGER